jgi:hypothetical protein
MPAFVGGGPYLLQIDAGLGTGAETFDVALYDAGGTLLLQQQDVAVDADGWVRLVYTQALAGEYRVELQEPDSADGAEVLTYAFAVRAR